MWYQAHKLLSSCKNTSSKDRIIFFFKSLFSPRLLNSPHEHWTSAWLWFDNHLLSSTDPASFRKRKEAHYKRAGVLGSNIGCNLLHQVRICAPTSLLTAGFTVFLNLTVDGRIAALTHTKKIEVIISLSRFFFPFRLSSVFFLCLFHRLLHPIYTSIVPLTCWKACLFGRLYVSTKKSKHLCARSCVCWRFCVCMCERDNSSNYRRLMNVCVCI